MKTICRYERRDRHTTAPHGQVRAGGPLPTFSGMGKRSEELPGPT